MPPQIDLNNPQFTKDFYTYSFLVPTIAAAAQATAGINIQADAAFMAIGATYFVDLAGAAQTDSTRVIPLVTLAINDSGSGRNLQQQPVPIPVIGGTGVLPFLFPKPRLFLPNSAITATFNNYSAAQTYLNLYYTLIGYQIFKYG